MLSRNACVFALVLLAVACKEEAPPPAAAPVAVVPDAAPPPPPPVDAAPPPEAALPTDAKELAELRKKAILESRIEDAVKICAVEDVKSIGEQSILSCVLSACQINQVEKAQQWSQHLKGALKANAKKICAANGVPL